ncbi:MAG: hypothetical protein OIF55_17550 [Amphritea sp.]|nr:hypothetical protein [Amphritea sp.]
MLLLRLLRLFTLLAISGLPLQGCFYMVEEGKGGVAERFPIPAQHLTLSQRLMRCEAAMSAQHLQGKTERYPALYKETQAMLTESRRLFKAEFYQQAELTLEPVEQVLQMMHQNLHLKAVSHLCQDTPTREVCL